MTEGKKKLTVASIVKAFFYIMGLLAMVYAFISFIDKRIEDKITDPTFLSKVARKVRPAIGFDAKGRVLGDMGGMDYLADIQVINPKNAPLPEKIIVTPRRFLSQAPVLIPLDSSPFGSFSVDRGEKMSWVYTCGEDTVSFGLKGLDVKNVRFRLEIVPQ